jgi:hypothetical protein
MRSTHPILHDLITILLFGEALSYKAPHYSLLKLPATSSLLGGCIGPISFMFCTGAEVKNAWSYTSTSPIHLHGVVLSYAQGQLYLYLTGSAGSNKIRILRETLWWLSPG